MTTHNKDKIIAEAKEAGCHHASMVDKGMRHWRCTTADMERFYTKGFEGGRQAEREELSAIFEKMHTWLTNIAVIATIRARSTK